MKKMCWVLLSILLASCQRGCANLKRGIQTSERHYHVEQYSGGKLIGYWDFIGILNNQDSSDGFYWFNNDTLIEVSGDIKIWSYGK